MATTYIQKGSNAKVDILSTYKITNKHIPDIQLELKELFKRDWAEQQGDQEYIPSTAIFKAYEQDLEFVCMDTLATAGTTIKTFLAYLQGEEFNFYSEYNNRGFRCRYIGYDSKAFYREAKDVVVFNIKVKINNPLSYGISASSSTIIEQSGVGMDWHGIAANPTNGHVYACTGGTGDIYKQTAGLGSFYSLNATGSAKNWSGLSLNSTTGDVFACAWDNGIYKQSAGTGDFVTQSAGIRSWSGVSVNKTTGDVYACVHGGDIYKQTAGTGSWTALDATGSIKSWKGVAVNSETGDIYACVLEGDIYKQTAGTGSWVALNATGASKSWTSISVNSANGDVYACAYIGDIYKQTAGAGDFTALNATEEAENWWGISVGASGDVYACSNLGDIYKQVAGTGDFTGLDAIVIISASSYRISFVANSSMIVYWDDGTNNTYSDGSIYGNQILYRGRAFCNNSTTEIIMYNK